MSGFQKEKSVPAYVKNKREKNGIVFTEKKKEEARKNRRGDTRKKRG